MKVTKKVVNHQVQPDDYCCVDKYLTLISTKWTAHIVWLLGQSDEMRFGQIRKQLALVSSKVLTERLKLLQQYGFVWRRQEDTIPVTVNYGLTHKGKEFTQIVNFIVQKADDWDSR
ncbi:winged helix-turn-helix transcriptional regulator [Vibrio diabolicus]|uniref:Transcriptional regulator n=1 Tax=Vibrio diabolicus TaxID=50719 RepID=A0AAX1XSN7_9VIBR|nr:helix-turn-helix domain-containing protein [Vibrio diabolicus]MCS0347175.1 helix-turn-helix transcriptional regulator [Vibrio diabolicus]MCS0359279.1 helix-turn-helix transcriptional regulator [Vibrio diabolicus]MCS0373830.1 helix-turn-helix transcriptional regulator [Vibrio diabolicus]MCS0428910.1 helix-turn-helix transcriptional regulator [Vibrio diabolicus]MCS0439676.1 helix-turn-helix transcriptional regulator [Vibrio diabolicus]